MTSSQPVWVGQCANPTIAWLGVVVAAAMLVLAFLLSPSVPAWATTMTVLLAVGILVALVIASRLAAEISQEGFVVRWGITRWPRRRIPWSDVVALSIVDIDPWHWGGWGYRWMPGRKATAAVVRGGPGIQLDLRDGRHFLVTVPDAEAGVAAGQQFVRLGGG